MKNAITTHVLDTSLGKPAAGLAITLCRIGNEDELEPLATGTTNSDGRVMDLVTVPLAPGVYLLTFDTAGYFARLGTESFYPKVAIQFEINDASEHYHVPLLLSPFGYSTYRGS